MLTIELPFPPSANHYYRHIGHCTLISKRGRQYREAVMAFLATLKIQPLAGPLSLIIELYPPDRRRRDVDNSQKSLLDSLAHGGAFKDDSQIVHLETWKCSPVRSGKAIVRIKELGYEWSEINRNGIETLPARGRRSRVRLPAAA